MGSRQGAAQGCSRWKGRLIAVTSALFLVSVPKPGRAFAAQRIREARGKEACEISRLSVSCGRALTIFSWKCPSYNRSLLCSQSSPPPSSHRLSLNMFILPFGRDLGRCRAGRTKD